MKDISYTFIIEIKNIYEGFIYALKIRCQYT